MQYNDLMDHLDLEDLLDNYWEEEEEEEELELDDDRGDDVDPDLPEEEDPEDEPETKKPEDDDIDPDDLKDLAGDDDDKPRMIPYARFHEVNEAMKLERAERLRLEEESARLRGSVPDKKEPEPEPEPEFDVKAARRQLREAIYEGDDDKADQLQEQIDAAQEAKLARIAEEKAEARYRARLEAEQKKEAEKAQTRIEQAAEEVANAYAWLDADSPDYDKRAVARAVAYRDMYIQEGKDPADAIRMAAEDVQKEISPEEPAPRGRPKPTREQLERNLEREKRIPSRDAGVGERSQKIDFTKLSEEEFSALPESEKKKARGDYVG